MWMVRLCLPTEKIPLRSDRTFGVPRWLTLLRCTCRMDLVLVRGVFSTVLWFDDKQICKKHSFSVPIRPSPPNFQRLVLVCNRYYHYFEIFRVSRTIFRCYGEFWIWRLYFRNIRRSLNWFLCVWSLPNNGKFRYMTLGLMTEHVLPGIHDRFYVDVMWHTLFLDPKRFFLNTNFTLGGGFFLLRILISIGKWV